MLEKDHGEHTPPHGDPLVPRRSLEDTLALEAARDVLPVLSVSRLRVRVYRITIATIPPPTYVDDNERWTWTLNCIDGARRLSGDIADLSVTFGYGLGSWGQERVAVIETATPMEITPFVVSLLSTWGQDCAYVVSDGVPWECDASGHWSRITAVPGDPVDAALDAAGYHTLGEKR